MFVEYNNKAFYFYYNLILLFYFYYNLQTRFTFTLNDVSDLTVRVDAPDGVRVNRIGRTIKNKSWRKMKNHN